jgi:hypothetical protein
MKLIMTLLVRDEEDILAANFDFHIAQGVDFFIVTDNLSVDGTRDIIERYVRRGLAVYLHESADDFAQSRWVTRMARLASSCYSADWVINSDADEFWVAQHEGKSLKDVLSALPSDQDAVSVDRSNYVPTDQRARGFFAERMRLRERESYNAVGDPLPAKVCHKAFDDIEVDQGNHAVRRAGSPLQAAPASLRILHYPLRSYRQFESKIVHGGAAYARNRELSPAIGTTWRCLYEIWQAGGLRDWYARQLLSEAETESRLHSRDLIYDDTVLEALRHARREPAPWSVAVDDGE